MGARPPVVDTARAARRIEGSESRDGQKLPYRRVHVVINPASGKDEPILNVLNDVFRQHGVTWDVSVTHGYGDAAAQARAAIADGVDLVAGYGGDGTQHEIANAVLGAAADLGRTTPMGILPGRHRQRLRPRDGRARRPCARPSRSCARAPRRARIDVGRLRSVGSAQVAGPVLHPAALRRHRARGADQPRAEGPLRRLCLRGVRRPRVAARTRTPGTARSWTARRRRSTARRSTSSTPG